MKTTTLPATPINPASAAAEPATRIDGEKMAPWDILRMCAAEIGASPTAVESCTSRAQIGHLMPDLLSSEEKEHLAELDKKSAAHQQSIDHAIAMPASRVAAAKELIECGAVPSETDFEEFELARARRNDRIKICKLSADTFYQGEVLPFAREICTRAAARLEKINTDRVREEQAGAGVPEPDVKIIGSIDPSCWQPSQTLIALAKLRCWLLMGDFQVNLASPSSLLSYRGLAEVLK